MKIEGRINNVPDTLAAIKEFYDFTPTEFRNGDLLNDADKNNGSCKIFSFAKLLGLALAKSLHCFGDYYRIDALEHPEATDHQNISNFMRTGWNGISFNNNALKIKSV